MKKIKNFLIRFMYGRYGVDELYYGLFLLWIALTVAGALTGSVVVSLLTSFTLVLMLYRMLSKNYAKRRRENEVFLKLWKPVKSWFVLQRDRIRDHKTARYRKCPSCRAIIKFPNKKGKHTAVCPKCGNRFGVRV